MSTFADLPHYLRLQCGWVKQAQLESINNVFGSLETAFLQSKSDWQKASLVTDTQLDVLFADDIESRVVAAQQWGELANQGWLMLGDENYSSRLKQIDDAPIVLGYRGDVGLLDDPQVAIVGSRHASKAGVQIAQDFAQFLSASGLGITSGLALGIDSAAHRGGLLGVGSTIAVVATGLDRIYPASNRQLGQQIVEQGLMLSEFCLGTKPLQYNFPRRNRIISGLSHGVLVVEAALKSGSLITARTAMEQGREVFAVPGSIHNPQVKGCHQLIKDGAKLVESGQDILQELAINLQLETQSQVDLAFEPEKPAVVQHELFNWVGFEPISLDELVVLSKMPVSSLQSELLILELAGQVEAMSAGRWRRLK